jgi:hypothetical protein
MRDARKHSSISGKDAELHRGRVRKARLRPCLGVHRNIQQHLVIAARDVLQRDDGEGDDGECNAARVLRDAEVHHLLVRLEGVGAGIEAAVHEVVGAVGAGAVVGDAVDEVFVRFVLEVIRAVRELPPGCIYEQTLHVVSEGFLGVECLRSTFSAGT